MTTNHYAIFALFCLCCLFGTSSIWAQQQVFIDARPQANQSVVQIAEDVNFPDIQVQLGRDIPFEDITVGITPFRRQANIIITRREADAGSVVRLDLCDNFPDLRILYGPDVRFPDVRIEFRDDNRPVDVLIYTEKTTVSEQELIACLLPFIKEKKAQR